MLDRNTGLLKALRANFAGRGLARVRVNEGDEDFVVPSAAAEGDRIVFLEAEGPENLSTPLGSVSGAEAVAAHQFLRPWLSRLSRMAQSAHDLFLSMPRRARIICCELRSGDARGEARGMASAVAVA